MLSLAVFNNTVALAASTAIYVLLRNLAYKVRGGVLFEGLEASRMTKALALLTGFKVKASEVDEHSHVFLLEEAVEAGKRLKVSHLARCSEKGVLGVRSEEKGWLGDEIWVAPALPLVAYMLVGLVVALTVGDLVTTLIKWSLSLLPP